MLLAVCVSFKANTNNIEGGPKPPKNTDVGESRSPFVHVTHFVRGEYCMYWPEPIGSDPATHNQPTNTHFDPEKEHM